MKIAAYKGLEIGKEELIKVTEAEVNSEIEKLVSSKVSFEAKSTKSELGDIVNINYKGLLNGEAFAGGTADGYDLELGSNTFIPGFEDQLVGYEAGSDVDVNLSFPEEYHAAELAGKAVVFKCHINEVKVKVTPELNDGFAMSLGLPNVEELKKVLEAQMNAKKQNEQDNKYLDKLVSKVLEDSEIDVDNELVEQRLDIMVAYYEKNMAQYGMTLETYLQMTGDTLDHFKENLKAEAAESVKADVLFTEIAKAEGLDVSDEELESELLMYKKYFQLDDAKFADFKKDKANEVKAEALRRKISTFLIEVNN